MAPQARMDRKDCYEKALLFMGFRVIFGYLPQKCLAAGSAGGHISSGRVVFEKIVG